MLKRPSLIDLVIVAGSLGLVEVQMGNFANDPGVGWHLKTGELITRGSVIPRVDPFLASATPRPWVSDQWFSDLLFFKVFELGSWPLLYAVLTALFVGIFFLLLAPLVRRVAVYSIPTALAVLLAFKASQVHFILRPTIFGFFFFVVLLRALYYAEERAQLGKSTGLVWAVPLLFMLWANMHPSFVMGVLCLAIWWVSAVIDPYLSPHAEEQKRCAPRTLCLVLLLSLVATLCNPYGAALHESIFALGRSAFFMSYHEEWLSPDFSQFEGHLILAFVSIVAVVGYFVPFQKWLPLREASLMGVFLVLALDAIRVLPYFAMVSAIPFARACGALSEISFWRRWRFESALRRAFQRLERLDGSGSRGVLSTWSVLLVLVCGVIWWGRVPLFEGSYGPTAPRYPLNLIQALVQGVAQDGETHGIVVAPPEWGGVITWFGYPGIRAVIDDRNTLLGEQSYRSFSAALQPGGDYAGYLERCGATHLLLPSRNPLAEVLKVTGQYSVVREEERAILFQIRKSR